jgi:DNA polymerase IV (DinB-like DNA polymerase)
MVLAIALIYGYTALPQNRIIVHVDLDYFFAQIEELEHPEYRGKPVVVCVYSGRTDESGAVSTANYVARQFGVRSGMPISWAKRALKSQEAVFLPVNREKYDIVSDQIMDILRVFGDIFEQVSVDEAYLDVSEKLRGDFERAERLGREIKASIREKVGLTCSVGIGPNKLVAKIAANIVKPDGLTIVLPGSVNDFLRPLPIGRLYGVGKKTEKILTDRGLKTVGDLADQPVDQLSEIFGRTLGNYFHESANGIDRSEVKERGLPKSLSRITTLKSDTRKMDEMRPILEILCDDLIQKLNTYGIAFRSAGIIAITTDMSVQSRSLSLDEPVTDKKVLLESVQRLLEDYLRESRQDLRRIGVRVSAFSPSAAQKSISSYFG